MFSAEELTQALSATPSLLPIAARIAQAGEQEDRCVLLTGEPGTGKRWLARLIHACSPRSGEPFAVINCGGFHAASLLERELYGHEKGVVLGVNYPTPGKMVMTGKGTLLVGDFDDLDLNQQAKLLRVIETGAYEPVGSTQTRHSTARIILVSHCNLERKVQRGEVLKDLCCGVNVLAFHLLPLRERRQDIAPLARMLLKECIAQSGGSVTAISPEAMGTLKRYPWPSNIRELSNIIECAVVRSKGSVLLPAALPEPFRSEFAQFLARC